jgi:UDP-GlcNAc3NAcA epimerase
MAPLVLSIVGTRPQLIKASAVSAELARDGRLRELVVDTGQHYDPELSTMFLADLGAAPAAINLGVGSGSHGAQTADMLRGLERVMQEARPDLVLVYGDTNSTLAAALAAAKLALPIVHVEAGLRSFERHLPEEINRVVTDRLATLRHCPTPSAVTWLAREGITEGVELVGDVMVDVARRLGAIAGTRAPLARAPGRFPTGGFLLATLHRAENTDDRAVLAEIMAGLARVAEALPVVLPLHPRTRRALAAAGLDTPHGVEVMPPLGPLDMVYLERRAAVIVTDSGGVQREACFQGTRCVTIRERTEWPETVTSGWNRLASPRDRAAIATAVADALRAPLPAHPVADFGAGDAAARIVASMRRHLGV